MSSPLRSGLTAAMAAVYVSATAGVLIWGVDLAIVSGVESLLESFSMVPAAWMAEGNTWDMYAALALAVPMSAYLGTVLGRRAYLVERSMTDV